VKTLLIIYGMPASGKLSIATEIKKQLKSDSIILHNHLTLNLAKQLFEFGSKKFHDLTHELRAVILKELLKDNRNILFTTGWLGGKEMLDSIKKTKQLAKKHGFKINFVKLKCTHESLLKRVTGKSRKKHHKLTTKKQMQDYFKKLSQTKTFPFKNQLILDNTNLPIKESAKTIIEHFNIK
jgi:shikimate kinase